MKVWVSKHAAAQYVERVKPCLRVNVASWELGQLCLRGRVVGRPSWCAEHERADWWLELADGIVAIVRKPFAPGLLPTAVTVQIRGGQEVARREAKNAAKARARHGRRLRNLRERGRPVGGRDFRLSEDQL